MTVTTEAYFAIIPEWVLYSDVSAQAVRLYAVLARYAENPGRARLAKDMGCSTATVGRALKELVELDAVQVQGWGR